MASRVIVLATLSLLVNIPTARRLLKITDTSFNASSGNFDPNDLCSDSQRFSPGSCDMFHQWLVMIPSASGVSGRFFAAVRGRRNMHLTARVKAASDSRKQLGKKMRTAETKGTDPEWKQALIVPVVCPEKPNDVNIEFNLRDERAMLPNGQVGQLRVSVGSIEDGAHSYDVEDFKVTIDSKWCDSWSCVQQFMRDKDAQGNHLLHEGLECGSSCHHLLATMNKNVVKKALKHLKEAKRAHQVEERADDRGDDAEDAQDDAEDAGDYQALAMHKRQEDYWDEIEDEAEEDKEEAWDKMREKLASIGGLLRGACGHSMPEIPLALGGKVKKDFKEKQVKKLEHYLHSVEADISSLSNCLRDKWFRDAEYAPTSQVNNGCPRARAASSYIPYK